MFVWSSAWSFLCPVAVKGVVDTSCPHVCLLSQETAVWVREGKGGDDDPGSRAVTLLRCSGRLCCGLAVWEHTQKVASS